MKTERFVDGEVFLPIDLLIYVPDRFITSEILKECRNEDLTEEYKERKEQKAKIKEELFRIAWDPSRVIDWCFSEDEKQDLEKLCRLMTTVC